MKANKYISAVLIALMAAASIQAQTARRSDTRERETRSTVRRESPESNRKKAGRPDYRESSRSPVKHAARVESRNTAPVVDRKVPRADHQTTVRRPDRPVSMSTGKHPRSTYRKPTDRVNSRYVHPAANRSKRFREKQYYGGRYYHNAYPTSKVHIHYHHDTYWNRYRVLYYPTVHHIYWSRKMHRDYLRWYPEYHWPYRYGYRIDNISVFEARYNLGEVAMVYGRVYATWYNRESDDYLLFFGGDYPRQAFTLILPGRIARKFSWRPERYFLGEHVTVTGLITTFDGIPEIVVKNKRQLSIY